MHEEKGNVKLFTSTDHKGMYRIAFKHQTTNEVYSMQDLKDLRDLITEELGEECEHRGSENGICNGCGKEVYPQPLTEGEGETKIGIISSTEYRQGYWPGCKKENFINQHQKPQQESNKEEDECCHGCSTGKGCEKSEEPSKKPMCYCGHPEERHNEGSVVEPSIANGIKLSGYTYTRNCKHCVCKEYAEDNQGKI